MFVVHCQDRPDSSALRQATREAHLAYARAHIDRFVMGGPTLTDDRSTMTGSILVLNFTERAELDAFLAADPYAQAGLFESVTVWPYRKVLP